jgi:hypothetical protein
MLNRLSTSFALTALSLMGFVAVTHAQGQLQTPVDTAWVLTPSAIEANASTTLLAAHERYTCADSFEHMQVAVEGNVIQLGFTSTNNPAIRCAQPIAPIGPRFLLPALKAGTYSVFITDAPACVWTQGCKIAVTQELAGTLQVGNTPVAPEFSFTPQHASVDSAFDLQLLSYAYSCATEYSHLEYAVNGNTITLSFLATTRPDIMCPAIYRPYGPTFKIKGLKAGAYKVHAIPGLPCMYAEPRCLAAVSPIAAGQLNVTQAQVVGLRSEHGLARRSATRPAPSMRAPTAVQWILPSGASAPAVNASGRRLPQ